MAPTAIGYVRVSSEQQAGEKQTSLTDQRDAITALAGRLGVQLVEVFEDAGFSGATIAKRPALRAEGRRKQTARTVTLTTVVGTPSSITAAQRRRPA